MNEGIPKKSLLGKMREHGKLIKAGLGLSAVVGAGMTAEAQVKQTEAQLKKEAIRKELENSFNKGTDFQKDFEDFKKEAQNGFKNASEKYKQDFGSTKRADSIKFGAFAPKENIDQATESDGGDKNKKEGDPGQSVKEITAKELKVLLKNYGHITGQLPIENFLKNAEKYNFKVLDPMVSNIYEGANMMANEILRMNGISRLKNQILTFTQDLSNGKIELIKVIIETK